MYICLLDIYTTYNLSFEDPVQRGKVKEVCSLNLICCFRAYVYFSSPIPKELVAHIKMDTSVLPRIGALSEVVIRIIFPFHLWISLLIILIASLYIF